MDMLKPLKIFFNRFHISSYYSRFLRELYPYDCDLSLSRGCTMIGITNAGSSYLNSKDPSICIFHFRILFLLCPRSNLVWSIVVVSLLAKLEKYGLEESALKMFRSYLDDTIDGRLLNGHLVWDPGLKVGTWCPLGLNAVFALFIVMISIRL